MQFVNDLFQNVVGYFKGFTITPTYIQAGAIIVLVFLLVVSLAKFRHYAVKGTFQGGFVGIILGFILALILEGFLLISGRTVVTELLGWKEAPKPIKTALDIGHQKLITVLDKDGTFPESFSYTAPTVEDTINVIQSLNPDEIRKLKAIVCEP